MLVSSKTISIWDTWENVPPWICEAVEQKNEADWIAFIPMVMKGRTCVGSIPTWLKGLEKDPSVGVRSIAVSTGTIYVGTGETLTTCEILEAHVVEDSVGVTC